MSNQARPPAGQGFTLIEVLLTIALLGIALSALLRLQSDLLRYISLAGERTVAANLTEQKIEQLRSFSDTAGFEVMADGADTLGPPGSGAATEVAGLNTLYSRTWKVRLDNTTRPVLMSVDVTVSWKDPAGRGHSTRLSTAISEATPESSGRLIMRGRPVSVY